MINEWIRFRNKNEKGDFTHIKFKIIRHNKNITLHILKGWGDGEEPDLHTKYDYIYRKTMKSIKSNIKKICEINGIKI